MLKQHYAHDSACGIDSDFLPIFDHSTQNPARIFPGKQSGLSTIRSTRHIFKQITCQASQKIQIYHNLWGLPILADLDQSKKRIGILHSDWPTLEFELNAAADLLDGVLCVSNPLLNRVQKAGLNLEHDRMAFLPYPIAKPASFQESERRQHRVPLASKPLLIGFCGRLVKTQKRVDRLASIAKALDDLHIPFQLEILGTGPEESHLKNQFRARTNVIFHGLQRGEAYWRILAAWDAILFVSDYEGLPISMLEAMSLGVIPIYPKIKSGGDDYAVQVSRELLFDPTPAQFTKNAAAAIQWLVSCPPALQNNLRDRAIENTRSHSLENYFRVFSSTVRSINEKPRISVSQFKPRPAYWTDSIPYALLEKICRGKFFRKPIPLAAS